MAPRDLSDPPGPDDPPPPTAPNATPEERRARAGVPPRRPADVDETTPVVFISQLDTGGGAWRPVIDRLTCHAPTITYDRPGTGGTPPRPAPDPAIPYSVFADELAAHLDAAGAAPAIVVGHSVGSLIAQVFAGRHPRRVAGLVHVDGSLPRFHLPGIDATPAIDGGTDIDVVRGEVEVLRAHPPQAPTVVLSRTPGWYGDQLPHPAIDELWHLHQQHLAATFHARGNGGSHVVAKASGHDIPADAPALVAHVIDAVVRAARQDAPVRLDRNALDQAGGRLGYDSSMR